MGKGSMHAYRYGVCSALAPDSSGGYDFYQAGYRDQVSCCSWWLITLPSKIMCIFRLSCISKYHRIGADDHGGCYTRDEWLSQNSRNYIDPGLYGKRADRELSKLSKVQLCGENAELLHGRICVCQRGAYYHWG